jgi:PKD repeat protein
MTSWLSVLRGWLLAVCATILLTACDPIASIVLPDTVPLGTEVEFKSDMLPQYTADSYPDMQYEWDFGDGTTATGPVVKHTYGKPGAYDVILNISDTVTRDFGQAYSSRATIKVETPAEPPTAYGTTYHVRADGGTAIQCTGKANARYPGAGTGQDCAWINPMVALPNQSAPRIAGGDTLIIHKGQYQIGYGAPAGAESCSNHWTWDCVMADVPSGPDAAHPTQILGEGHDTGCAEAPQLWGTQRVNHVVGLSHARNVKMACLEITDHDPCVAFHSLDSQRCNRDNFPYGNWGANGLYAVDASNIELVDLNIHGLSNSGLIAGRIKDWTLSRVRLAANGWSGWEGDVGSDSSNSGTIRFSHVTIEWNGCAESYGEGIPTPTACWAQSAGGYGDGLGTAATAGHWVIEDSAFLHNTSDGLDLLYANGTGSVTLNRVRAEGNAGNQIKVSGPVSISNTIAVGSCGFFDGKPFTHNVDNCRALGDTVVMGATSVNDTLSMTNSTVIGQGNVIVLAVGPKGSHLTLQNNILIGKPFFLDPSKNTADRYFEANSITVTEDSNLKQDLRNADCSTAPRVICTTTAGVVDESLDAFDAHLLSASPARDSGLAGPGVPVADYFGRARPSGSGVDRGAVEY